jgi:hypothetical protein
MPSCASTSANASGGASTGGTVSHTAARIASDGGRSTHGTSRRMPFQFLSRRQVSDGSHVAPEATSTTRRSG